MITAAIKGCVLAFGLSIIMILVQYGIVQQSADEIVANFYLGVGENAPGQLRKNRPEPMHILYGGHGNHSGFLEEMNASLKSVLLNAPLDRPLHIHFLVDKVAQDALRDMLDDESIALSAWRTRQPLQIHSYNVEPFVPQWVEKIKDTYRHFPKELERVRHTPGAYFRLFANQVLPPTVQGNALHLDSDVYVMANLDGLWNHVTKQAEKNYFFQWGREQCSGFLVINIQKLPQFWDRIQTYELITLTGEFQVENGNTEQLFRKVKKAIDQKGLGDQFLIRSMQYTEPDLLGVLPKEWDVSANDGPWWKNEGQDLQDKFRAQGVGILHFNGGGSSKESVFESHPFLVQSRHEKNLKFEKSWYLARYYHDMPWNWAKFAVESKASGGGYSVLINHHSPTI